jgi:hypothetical protein
VSDESKSGINIGSIGNISDIKGNLAIAGDVVSGDKIVGNKVGGNFTGRDHIVAGDAAIQQVMGFASQAAQQQFIAKIEDLREIMMAAKGKIELHAEGQEGVPQLLAELSGSIKSLRDAQNQAKELPVGEPAPPEVADTLNGYLTATEKLIEKAQAFGEKAAELTLKVAPVALPLLESIRLLLRI